MGRRLRPLTDGSLSGVIPRCLTIAGSDSGGGAGIQADLKAFARAGCYGTTAVVALTAQSTVGVSTIHEVPPEFVRAQIDAVLDDIGADAAKTGMLFSAAVVEEVASCLAGRPFPIVVDPVMISTSGARLLREDAVEALVASLFPLATVVTPNLPEACALAGLPYRDDADRRALAEAIHGLGAAAVIVTGGHGDDPVDWLFDGQRHVAIQVERFAGAATHGSGCTHSATLTALLARGDSLEDAAHEAAVTASEAVRNGLTEIGRGNGPVDVFALRDAGIRAR
jgi:hydroxymethylpyrimidine/phosphomethylpyrimidine kinase